MNGRKHQRSSCCSQKAPTETEMARLKNLNMETRHLEFETKMSARLYMLMKNNKKKITSISLKFKFAFKLNCNIFFNKAPFNNCPSNFPAF